MAATRPLPYDLMRAMLSELGARVELVVITDLNDQVEAAVTQAVKESLADRLRDLL